MILSAGDGTILSACGYVQFAEKGVGNNYFLHYTHRFTFRYTRGIVVLVVICSVAGIDYEAGEDDVRVKHEHIDRPWRILCGVSRFLICVILFVLEVE